MGCVPGLSFLLQYMTGSSLSLENQLQRVSVVWTHPKVACVLVKGTQLICDGEACGHI